mgnify:CR=1 FL=1
MKYNQKLYLPEVDYKSDDFEKLEKQFELKNNNILIITFSDTLRFAEISAIACAGEINNELNKQANSDIKFSFGSGLFNPPKDVKW